MPTERIDFRDRGAFTETEMRIIKAAFETYFEGLGALPILGIGRHLATGGFMVIPWFDEHATHHDVIDIIEELHDYLVRAMENK